MLMYIPSCACTAVFYYQWLPIEEGAHESDYAQADIWLWLKYPRPLLTHCHLGAYPT